MKIGIFGSLVDPEVQELRKRIINRGVECLSFDLSRYPDNLSLAVTRAAVLVDGINLLDLDAAYLRSSGGRYAEMIRFDRRGNLMPIRFKSGVESERKRMEFARYVQKEIADRTIRQTVLLAYQSRRPLINTIHVNRLHRMKPFLFRYLDQNSSPIPKFMAASCGEQLRRFSNNNADSGSNTVVKPMAGIFKTEQQSEHGWNRNYWKVRGELYQTYIRGDTIRCYVLEGRVIAAAKILFRGTVDSSLSQTGIEVLRLPAVAKRIAVSAARLLGARFCGLDLMRERRSGKFYVIDCNFSPMFVNFAKLSMIDIPAHLADFLLRLARREQDLNPKSISLLRQAKELISGDRQIRRRLGM